MFALTFLAYNFKFLWAPLVDTVRLPLLGRFGQRRSWLWVTGVFVIASVVLLGSLDPQGALTAVALAAVLVGVAGATFDIVIDAYRIELLEPRQLGVGSGMSQYRLADRSGVGGRGRAGPRGSLRMGRGLRRGGAVCAARDGRWPGHGGAGEAPRAACRTGRDAGRAHVLQSTCRIHQARRGSGRARVRAHSQDRRHARESDAAAALPGSRIQQRRSRVLRRGHRFHGAAGGRVRRRDPLREAWHEAVGAHQPRADGRFEFRLCRPGRSRVIRTWGWRRSSASRTSPAASAA